MIEILLDQNVPFGLTRFIRHQHPNWKPIHLKKTSLWGASDDRLREHLRASGCMILTFDSDFINLKRFAPGTHPGVVYLAMAPRQDLGEAALQRLWLALPDAALVGQVTQVDASAATQLSVAAGVALVVA